MAQSIYTIHDLCIPLPPALCRRIEVELRRSCKEESVPSVANTQQDGTIHASTAFSADRFTQLYIRCDLRIYTQEEVKYNDQHASHNFSSHSTADGEANGTRSARSSGTDALQNGTGSVNGTEPSIPASTLTPLLSLADLHASIHFIISHFPFGSFSALVQGLATFILLWHRLSQAECPPSSNVHPDTKLRPVVHHGPPRISRVEIDAVLIAEQRILRKVSIHSRTEDAKFLGRDVNIWGDVDIILEVQQPAATNSTSTASHTDCHSTTIAANSDPRCNCVRSIGSSSILPPPQSAGLYCLNLLPHHTIPLHVHNVLDESEMIISNEGIWVQDGSSPAEFGDIHSWHRLAHAYQNRTPFMQRILCIDVPAFFPADEIRVEEKDYLPLAKPKATRMNWREVVQPQGGTQSPHISWTFPGGLPGQTVTLSTDKSKFAHPHAVLLFAFAYVPVAANENAVNASTTVAASSIAIPSTSSPSTSSPPTLLFVHHSKRGWELPGGKIDANETPEQAVVRETREEAGVVVNVNDLHLIAQYVLEEPGQPDHVKNVYGLRIAPSDQTHIQSDLQHETSAAKFLTPPHWHDMFRPIDGTTSDRRQFSSILSDNVYPICLKIALDVTR